MLMLSEGVQRIMVYFLLVPGYPPGGWEEGGARLPNKWSLFWHHKASSPCWCSIHHRREIIGKQTKNTFHFLSEKYPLWKKKVSCLVWTTISQEICCFEQFYWGSGGSSLRVSTCRLAHLTQNPAKTFPQNFSILCRQTSSSLRLCFSGVTIRQRQNLLTFRNWILA